MEFIQFVFSGFWHLRHALRALTGKRKKLKTKRVFMRNRLGFFAFCATLVLGGCGSSPDPVSTASFPVASAIEAYTKKAHSYTLFGTGGNSEKIVELVNKGQGRFNGEPFSLKIKRFEIFSLKTVFEDFTPGTEISATYFSEKPLRIIGAEVLDTNGKESLVVFDNQQSLPEFAKVGQNGLLMTDAEYDGKDEKLVSPKSTSIYTWSLEAHTSNTAWFCETRINKILADPLPDKTSSCYDIDASGNVLSLAKVKKVNGNMVDYQGSVR